MLKHCFSFMVAAALVVVSGSFAKADTYSIASVWSTGSTPNGNLVDYTGDGTFVWNGGATFSLVSFTFTETYYQSCGGYPHANVPCGTLPAVIWTATPQDGQIGNGNETLELGNSAHGLDCSGSSCVTVVLSSPLTLAGSGHTFTGTVASTTQDPNTGFVSGTVTDLPEPSAIALLAAVSGFLGFVIFRRRKLVK
jgi:hypothetical protein